MKRASSSRCCELRVVVCGCGFLYVPGGQACNTLAHYPGRSRSSYRVPWDEMLTIPPKTLAIVAGGVCRQPDRLRAGHERGTGAYEERPLCLCEYIYHTVLHVARMGKVAVT